MGILLNGYTVDEDAMFSDSAVPWGEIRTNGSLVATDLTVSTINGQMVIDHFATSNKLNEVENRLDEKIKEMKERLCMIERDIEMEKKYPELARAKTEYDRIKDKYETMEYIKGDR